MRTAFLVLCITSMSCAACRAAPSGGTARADGTIRLDVKGEAQRHNLSCESRSAVDVLAHYGIAMSEAQFFARLPKSDNPDLGFVGDVNAPTGQLPPNGYGVHEAPVAATLGVIGLPATPVRQATLAWLEEQLRARRPVIVWATSTLRPTKAEILRDNRGTAFQAVRGEHTFIASGWDRARRRITLIDSATGRAREVALTRFDAAWAALDRRAVAPAQAPR